MSYFDSVPSRAEGCHNHERMAQLVAQRRIGKGERGDKSSDDAGGAAAAGLVSVDGGLTWTAGLVAGTTWTAETSPGVDTAALIAAVPSLPSVDEEYLEWAGALEAIAAASGTFTVVELGARWGTWTIRSLVAARRLRPELELHGVLMEPEPHYFAWATEAVRLNGLEGVVQLHNNRSTAPLVLEILRSFSKVDLLDIDIQGAEGGLVYEAIGGPAANTKVLWAEIEQKVARLHVEIHLGRGARYADAFLFGQTEHPAAQAYLRANSSSPGWISLRHHPFGITPTCEQHSIHRRYSRMRSECALVESTFGPIYIRGGTTHMLNRRFRSTEVMSPTWGWGES